MTLNSGFKIMECPQVVQIMTLEIYNTKKILKTFT